MQGRIGNLYVKASRKDLLKMGEVTIGKLPSVDLDNLLKPDYPGVSSVKIG